ncbi:uncharacterized protein SAMN02745127_02480 [Oceanospirillum multiglobuliferum]|uniref:TRASH domain-containing protein n=1 Tax=Oceanospirillum multiglobuliferum TaxID=64969 RepID=A0A1T4RMT9_9GAMM|nr:PP0621 family protein [Oceanospirillum multiglobuliferum]OPX54769.1 hypothetical protein BTE48_12760 [Oceanospirillum multiglobuliferum]SKA17253.1 uncharacterized protein SAMN02745127_02480 [Oceanospirillum multiglobuliferum]
MGFMIFRLIIFIAIVWFGLRILKAYNQKKLTKNSAETNAEADQTPEQMVQCRFCNLHLPQKDAVKHEKLWFCCHEHLNRFLAHGPEKK